MEKIIGKLIKLEQHKANVFSEVYGVLKLENDKEIDFVVEYEVDDKFFNKVEPGSHYFMEGEMGNMDDELWNTFERNYPWNRPKDILFMTKFSDGTAVQELFVF